jgi:uncharacterized protein
MSGERDLTTLLRSMQPQLFPEDYVFCCVPVTQAKQLEILPVCQFREPEGLTLIITKQEAEQLQLDYVFVCKMITLTIHSSLEAVGFLAAIAQQLTEHGISSNVVSAYYHDHLFVPVEKAELAMQVLLQMTTSL